MKLSIKKFTVGIMLLAVIVFVMSYAVYAEYDIKILINGQELSCNKSPVIINSSTLVPMRDIFEALGAEVSWNSPERSATGSFNGNIVTIYPDDGRFLKNGEIISLPASPCISEGYTMIPLRAVAESFGYSVMWRGSDYTVSISTNGTMNAYFLDCGQADSIFIELPDGKCMLVDAGESSFGKELQAFINEEGYSHIDYVVATHPHSDHIGAMAYILENFTVGKFYMPEITHNTKTFEKMLDALGVNGCECIYISSGDFIEDTPYSIEVLSPKKDSYARMNNYSAVLKLSFNTISILLSADAEIDVEKELVSGAVSVDADVLKVGHHGSATSSCEEYLDSVSPRDAIISVGEGNSYGFPSVLVTNRLEKRNINIYRTDINGDICMTTDGYVYVIEGER